MSGGQEQDRSCQSRLSNISTDIESTAVRQHDVENDEVERLSRGFLKSCCSVTGRIYDVTFAAKAYAKVR
jgi:hypothetical protein